MSIKEEILKKYNELNEFLQGIDIETLQKEYTRSELKELQSAIYGVKLRSLAYEISEVVDKMKKEEYPELLGVHHYPGLKEIDFLSEKQKIELDKYLVKFRKGNYVSNLWRIGNDSKLAKKIEQFLIDKGIVEKVFYVNCSRCSDNYLSKQLTETEKLELDELFKDPSKIEERQDKLEDGTLYEYCDECSYEINFERPSLLQYAELLKLVKERDKSLDNV